MLKITNFTKIYDNSEVKAVDDLSLELNRGEVFGLLGPNGAGKSTTIKSIVGILPLTQGEILVDDISMRTNSVQARALMGYVPDNHAVFERLTGREYVNHIANIYGVSAADRKERIEKYLELLSLKNAFGFQIKSYSHGMKQKIAIIAALVHNPRLWILDEPLTGLDPQSAYQVKLCMKNHAKEGNTVLFSSHILDVVEKICDRVGIIKSGKFTGVHDMKKMREAGESLEELFMTTIYGADYKFEEIM